MGEKSEILESLSKLSVSVVLSLVLGMQMYFQWYNDYQWSERMHALMERQAAAAEKQVDNQEVLAQALRELIEKHSGE